MSRAQYNLALRFRKGYKKLSFAWMRKAADQGNTEALLEIGMYYELGYGVKRDYKKAQYYYAKAAEQGNTAAAKRTTRKYWKRKRREEWLYKLFGVSPPG